MHSLSEHMLCMYEHVFGLCVGCGLRGVRNGTDLVDVLAEGGQGGELADEVEVGSRESVNSTAVKRRQRLLAD